MAFDSETMAISNRRFEPNKKKETCLTVFVVLLVILSIILLSLLLFFALKDKKRDENTPCYTKNCVFTASTFLDSMDQSVDPCENFYEFTCGNFIRNHPVPEDQPSTSTFLQYHDLLQLQQKILIEEYDSRGKTPVLSKVQEAYHVCLNTSYQKEKEVEAFRDFIVKELDGWPLSQGSPWKPQHKKIDDYLAKVLKYDAEVEPVNLEPMPLPDNPYKFMFKASIHAIDNVFTTDLIFSPPKAPAQEALQKIFFKLVDLFGPRPSNASISEDLDSMEEVHQKIKDIMDEIPDEDYDEEQQQLMTFNELSTLTEKALDYVKIINSLLGEKIFKGTDTILVIYPNQFKKLSRLIKDIPRRTLVNRIVTSAIFKLLPIIVEDMDEELGDLIKGIFHSPTPSSRSAFCLKFVKDVFPSAITRMFVERHVDKGTNEEADMVIKYLQRAYKEQIETSEWLDKATKDRALLKVDKMTRLIGYPDFTFDDKGLEKEYSHISPVQPTHFLNFLTMKPEAELKKVVKFMFPGAKREIIWLTDPLIINAEYNPKYNAMYFPAGILQLPFFQVNRPLAVNFGTTGAIAGHELGHAFDDSGKNYNEMGDKENWWTNETEKIFSQKSDCFINQYNNYCPEKLQGGPDDKKKICVNGENTLGENLADNTGLKAAYEAYKLWIKDNGKEKPLPGLETYTPEQIFFISFAYVWCENIPIDQWAEQAAGDVHSPGRYRVYGALSNNKDFREAFKCNKKGLMNRAEDTCTLW